jgi:4-hydroxy-tetrahydrodipicolinate reductase
VFDRPGSEGSALEDQILVTAEQALNRCDVIIDFSSAAASARLAHMAAEKAGPALVIGSTGCSPAEEAVIVAASEQVAILKSGNFSLGVAILAALVERTARRLEARDWDIEIFEAHHRRKRDAPSGTALSLGEAAARGRGVSLAQVTSPARVGLDAQRREGDIGFSVMRGGEIVGEHSVVFAASGEILTLSHSARDRPIFAKGAVEAALWLAHRTPGLYAMSDVLDLVD